MSRRIKYLVAAIAFSQAALSLGATITGGDGYSIAKRSDGTVLAWGGNLYGSLGTGASYSAYTPQIAKSFTGADAVAAGGSHTLILKSDKTVWSWGYNGSGQLGIGNTSSSSSPVQVQYLRDVIAVAAGNSHSLALELGGTVWSWGYNYYGQLALSNGNKSAPLEIADLANVVAIAAGDNSSYARKSDGTVWAWGYNGNGELGNGSTNLSDVPVQVAGATSIAAIAAGSGHVVALRNDGTVMTWGDNAYCQLGNSVDQYNYCTDSKAAVAVSGLSGVVAVGATARNSIALKSDGTVWVWGSNQYGQLGDNSQTGSGEASLSPVQVAGLSSVSEIASSRGNQLLARKATGEVYSWGYNGNGELGNNEGGNAQFEAVPVRVVGAGGDGWLNLASSSTSTGSTPPTTTTELCKGAVSMTTALFVDFPCVTYNNVDYTLKLMFDPSIGSGTYFKLIEANAQ